MSKNQDRGTVGIFPFEGELSQIDSRIDELIKLEEERQARRLIMIPSESLCHPVVRETMSSVYGNLYAEGYPSSLITHMDENDLGDLPFQLVSYRRYADRRFYKGTDYINVVESVCKRRASEAFANELVDADNIFANVQALSGAAANLAVQEAFLNPGDTILAMDLMHGGHLSHGSEFHMSGRKYRIVAYGISKKSGLLDYDEIERLAMIEKPSMIIAGYTSYPYAPNWKRFSEIAKKCGAVLMADIAHPAGMVIAGAYPSPIGFADVVTMTTHKTLMGPRGAIILTTDLELANMVDLAVFPGEQGGPHINTICALAVALKIAVSDEFKLMQRQIVENSQIFAEALKDAGLALAYGGTDTHLLLLDLKNLPKVTSEGLSGEIAVRLLEICGVVANKNTIPGDSLTAMASGVRMGTPWLTQRGITKKQLQRLANSIARLLMAVHPFHYDGLTGTLPRGKLDFNTLEEVKQEIAQIADELLGKPKKLSGFPHYSFYDGNKPQKDQAAKLGDVEKLYKKSAVFFVSNSPLIRVTGMRVEAHLQNLVTADLGKLEAGQALRTLMLDGAGEVLDDVVVMRCATRDDLRDNGFYVFPNPERAETILAWMRGHAEGYLLFEPLDITAKVEGPVVVENLSGFDAPLDNEMVALEIFGEKYAEISQNVAKFSALLDNEKYSLLLIKKSELESVISNLQKTGISQGNFENRQDIRQLAACLKYPLNVSKFIKEKDHKWFDLYKPYFVGQNLLKEIAADTTLKPFSFTAKETTELKHTTLFDEHKKRSKKLVDFAGWQMPVWYTSTMEEHKAVRDAAGLFDVSHMGVFEVSGENATDFLDFISTNYSRWIRDGESYYSFLLDINGDVIDDIMVYRMNANRYLVVVNAGNEEEDWAWMNAVNDGKVLVDAKFPQKQIVRPAVLRNLKDRKHGEDCRVNIALQGQKSREILLKLLDPSEHNRLKAIKRTGCGEFTLASLPVVLSRTGYTGEMMGFEIFAHPDKLPELWNKLLEVGEPFGLSVAGLAARDSLRTEAGLPLYGHELAGQYGITPAGASFPSYVKFHKPFFVGKQAMLEKEAARKQVVVRFDVSQKGTKPLKPGDPIANSRGDFIGNVTSCAVRSDGLQIGLGYVKLKAAKPGKIAIFPLPPESRRKGMVSPLELEQKFKTLLPVMAEIIDRFPLKPTAKELVKSEGQILIEMID